MTRTATAEEQPCFHSVTGIILAGGKSRRMGQDKAFLPIDGHPLVERVIRLFTASFSSVLVIGGDPERFAGYNLAHYPDIYPGCALGGLYTGLYHAGAPHIFASACDLPFPSKRVIDLLLSLRQGCDTVVAKTAAGLEPLFAVYGKSCLETMRLQLEAGNPCILDIFPKLVTRTVSEAELSAMGDAATDFYNLNTPEDLERLPKKPPTDLKE
jgi:molybdopterin-guanine dinucleotide biosynthesis protein A